MKSSRAPRHKAIAGTGARDDFAMMRYRYSSAGRGTYALTRLFIFRLYASRSAPIIGFPFSDFFGKHDDDTMPSQRFALDAAFSWPRERYGADDLTADTALILFISGAWYLFILSLT